MALKPDDSMKGHEVIGLANDLVGIYGLFIDGVKELNDWITKKPNASDPILDTLNKINKILNQIDDLTLASWVTEREENLSFLMAHATTALQNANRFLQSGDPKTDPEWTATLALADNTSSLAINTFLGDFEGGFWIRPNSVKALSEIVDPTSVEGWMSYMPDRAESHSFGRVWDHRWALPIAVYVISVRIVIIHTLEFSDEIVLQEVNRYKDFIDRLFKKMESGVPSEERIFPKRIP